MATPSGNHCSFLLDQRAEASGAARTSPSGVRQPILATAHGDLRMRGDLSPCAERVFHFGARSIGSGLIVPVFTITFGF